MLVLSRKKSEKIFIGHDIEIKLLEIRGDHVRLGVLAPRDVPVHREEIYLRIFGNGEHGTDEVGGQASESHEAK